MLVHLSSSHVALTSDFGLGLHLKSCPLPLSQPLMQAHSHWLGLHLKSCISTSHASLSWAISFSCRQVSIHLQAPLQGIRDWNTFHSCFFDNVCGSSIHWQQMVSFKLLPEACERYPLVVRVHSTLSPSRPFFLLLSCFSDVEDAAQPSSVSALTWVGSLFGNAAYPSSPLLPHVTLCSPSVGFCPSIALVLALLFSLSSLRVPHHRVSSSLCRTGRGKPSPVTVTVARLAAPASGAGVSVAGKLHCHLLSTMLHR
jgi:hypothetical protein